MPGRSSPHSRTFKALLIEITLENTVQFARKLTRHLLLRSVNRKQKSIPRNQEPTKHLHSSRSILHARPRMAHSFAFSLSARPSNPKRPQPRWRQRPLLSRDYSNLCLYPHVTRPDNAQTRRPKGSRSSPPHLPRPAYRASVAALAGRHQGSWARYQSMVDRRPSEKSVWAGRQPSSRRSFEASMA